MSNIFNLSNRVINACPFCAGNPSKTRLVKNYTGSGELHIVECDPCGIAWQWPVAWEVAEGTAFFNENYKNCDALSQSYFEVDQRAAVAKLQMNFVKATCEGPRKLLDIGAGIGVFVKEAALQGWDAVGLDLSHVAAESARSEGITVIQGTIDDMPVGHTFDSITMWDVIEHVDDPLCVVRSAFERLLPGGWLFVETGNYQSASLAATGSDWWLWQADHRWYFSPPSLSALLEGVGFSNLALASTTFRPAFEADREPKSSWQRLLKALVRHPLKARHAVSRHFAIQKAWERWPRWAYLPIFAIAAQKPFA